MIIFDFETIPRLDPNQKLYEWRKKELPYKTYDSRLKDPPKVIANMEQIDKYNEGLEKGFRDSDAKDIDYAKICAIGIIDNPVDPKAKIMALDKTEENEMVEKFINRLSNDPGPYIGYNIASYDIPLLKRVCLQYGIMYPKHINRSNTFDLFFWFKETYQMQPKKLIEYAMIYGYDVDLSIANAKNIYDWHCNGDYDSIKKHLAQDVIMTWHIYSMINACNMVPQEYEYGEPISSE